MYQSLLQSNAIKFEQVNKQVCVQMVMPRTIISLIAVFLLYNQNFFEQLNYKETFKLKYFLFDAGKYFIDDDILFFHDGLHLNQEGSRQLLVIQSRGSE